MQYFSFSYFHRKKSGKITDVTWTTAPSVSQIARLGCTCHLASKVNDTVNGAILKEASLTLRIMRQVSYTIRWIASDPSRTHFRAQLSPPHHSSIQRGIIRVSRLGAYLPLSHYLYFPPKL